MSVETWKAEFYPIPASSPELKTKTDVIEHSLWKWIGLLPKNLEKHSVKKKDNSLCGDGLMYFFVSDESCSLCLKYYDRTVITSPCLHCPLFQITHTECGTTRDVRIKDPFQIWFEKDNPIPMIEALAGALDKEMEND